MPLIWTDENDRVKQIHYRPDELTDQQKEGSIRVGNVPELTPDVDERPLRYYTEGDGFWIEYEEREMDNSPEL